MKNNHGNNERKDSKDKNRNAGTNHNHQASRKHCARQPRHRNHAVLLRLTARRQSDIAGETVCAGG